MTDQKFGKLSQFLFPSVPDPSFHLPMFLEDPSDPLILRADMGSEHLEDLFLGPKMAF